MGAICMFGSCLHGCAHVPVLFACSIPVTDATHFMQDSMKDKYRMGKTSHVTIFVYLNPINRRNACNDEFINLILILISRFLNFVQVFAYFLD